MFTGVIRDYATVISFSNNILKLKADYIPKIGDSISINGACLSVVELFSGGFSVELSLESSNILALKNYKDKIHIEPALKLSDRIDGHLLQGHIDGTGEIIDIQNLGNSKNFYISTDKDILKFISPKGSIAIDGVSLTINDVFKDSFRLTIIPLTLNTTLFGNYNIGRIVNIEADMFMKYIYYMFNNKNSISWSDIDTIMAKY